jgi:large subunit ribosomal protein L33
MAKKGVANKVRMESTAGTGFRYYKKKGKNATEKLKLRKYDPIKRQHVVFEEKKMPPSKKN